MGIKIKLKDITKEQYDKWAHGCDNRECKNCPLRIVNCGDSYGNYSWIHDKSNFSDKFLNNEIEVPIPTEDKALLRFIPNRYKYIARDKSGELYVYENMPYRFDVESTTWANDGDMASIEAFNDYFVYIKWDDKEPTLIEDLLKE